jgi:hypothetical protein
VRFVGEPLLARVSPHHWSSTTPLAHDAPCRGGQGETARWPNVAVGCGPSLRLFRSKPPDPRFHRHGSLKSGRLASRTRPITSRKSTTCVSGTPPTTRAEQRDSPVTISPRSEFAAIRLRLRPYTSRANTRRLPWSDGRARMLYVATQMPGQPAWLLCSPPGFHSDVEYWPPPGFKPDIRVRFRPTRLAVGNNLIAVIEKTPPPTTVDRTESAEGIFASARFSRVPHVQPKRIAEGASRAAGRQFLLTLRESAKQHAVLSGKFPLPVR